MRRCTTVAISVIVIISIVAGVIIASSYERNVPQEIKIHIPEKSYQHVYQYVIGVFSFKNEPMLYLGANTRQSLEDENSTQGTFYITNIKDKYSIEGNDWKEILTVHEEIERIKEYNYGNFEYFSIILSNLTTIIVKINENMQVEKAWYVHGLEVHSMLILNGYFYLFGKNGNLAELVRTQNFRNFTEIYKIKNVDFIFNSYLLSLNNDLYLAYGVSILNLNNEKSALLKISEAGCKEIVNTTKTWEIFAFLQNNKIFYYELYGGKPHLFVINPHTDKIERSYTLPGIVFYHGNGITVAIGRNILYSKDGIDFVPVCSRNGMNYDIISPDQIVVVNHELYVLLFNGQTVMIKCRV